MRVRGCGSAVQWRDMSQRKSVKRQLTQEMVLNPQGRVRQLGEAGSSVNVDKAVPVKRYFRSGSEMERQVGKAGERCLQEKGRGTW